MLACRNRGRTWAKLQMHVFAGHRWALQAAHCRVQTRQPRHCIPTGAAADSNQTPIERATLTSDGRPRQTSTTTQPALNCQDEKRGAV